MDRTEVIETTLGELIAELTEEAMRFFDDEQEVHNVVAFALAHLMRNRRSNLTLWN